MSISRRTTLSKYLIEQQRENHNLPADLRLLIEVVARACKAISYNVSKGALGDALGTAGSENVQGEVQKKLDILSNEILLDANEWGGNLAAMASEEMETFFPIPANYPRGEYLLVFDPLDGSSNIDVNVSIGTIFSVLRCPDGQQATEESFLQPGTKQVAAGYAVYGPQTVLVLTTGNGVNCFTLDRELGSWVLTQEQHADPGRHARIRDQRVERAPLVRAGQALRRRAERRQGRPARQELQHALDRLDGGRRAPHPEPRRHLHVPGRRPHAGAARASCA